MASKWQKKLARLTHMGWEELSVRAGQELHKRGDLLKHKTGWQTDLKQRLDVKPAPPLFSRDEIAQRVELIRSTLPAEAAAIVREADDICAHRFQLLGYENLDFHSAALPAGAIDWHLDPVHGKRAPREPWFKINFLDFELVGDHKVTWELNRHQHLVTLAKAKLLTGDDRYAVELLAQWDSWIQANPYPLGINWGSTLEVAFRTLSWIWIDQLLAGTSPHADFRTKVLPALAFQGRYIERYLSTYFSPNTHLLGEAVALFFLATLYPQLESAARWRQSAWRIILHEAGRQVRPDGVYFEQSLHYHVYALDFFLHARFIAAHSGVEIPADYDRVLNRMLDVLEALAQAGPAEGFGDDDGGRVWNPRRNQTEHMTDPLALGSLTYSKTFSTARLTEESLWLFGRQAVENFPSTTNETQNAPAVSKAFPQGGLYVLADSYPFPQQITVDAGPQGVGRSGHGHADALSVRLTMNGRRWLVDAGSGVYISKDLTERNSLRGTAAHNTLLVDQVDQAVPGEPFSWTHIPATVAEEWITGKSFSYFAGSHNGYSRFADPVVHRRSVFKLTGGPCLIRDIALGHGEHDIDLRWHFAPDLTIRPVGMGSVEIRTSSADAAEVRLHLHVPVDSGWANGLEFGSTQISPAYGAYQSAPLVRSKQRVRLPVEAATLLVPKQSAIINPDLTVDSRFTSFLASDVQTYEFASPDATEIFCYALGGEVWTSDHWSSDALVVYAAIERGRLSRLVVIGGTHLSWRGQSLLRELNPAGSYEWTSADLLTTTESGAFARPLFDDLSGPASSQPAAENALSNPTTSTYAERR